MIKRDTYFKLSEAINVIKTQKIYALIFAYPRIALSFTPSQHNLRQKNFGNRATLVDGIFIWVTQTTQLKKAHQIKNYKPNFHQRVYMETSTFFQGCVFSL